MTGVSKENMGSNPAIYLTYQGEDDQFYSLLDGNGKPVRIPKNRSIPESFRQVQTRPLAPVFRVLAIAILGLAPAGLGTLFIVPLAVLWTLGVILTRSLNRADRIRAAVVVGISISLLGLAIFLGLTFYSRLS